MSRRQYATVGAVGVVALSLAATATTAAAQPAASSAQGPQRVVADFNHDGRPDLVVGVPGKDVNGKANAGAVNVFYGSSSGTPGSRRVFTQDTPGILDQSETGDQFGFSVSTGDYNGDGYTDLAVGVPYEDISYVDQGAVNVIYGSRWGLQASGDDLWTQGQGGTAGTAGARDQFGYSLASGNFGRNVSGRRYDDLAVGVPLDDGTRTDDGSVNVIYGRAGGLSSYGNQRWTQGQGPYGAGNAPEVGDRFGRTLAAGNLGRDGYDDLAVGVPYEDWNRLRNAGIVNVIYGSTGGLSRLGRQVWSQSDRRIQGAVEAGDYFGYSLAIGNFGKTGYADLAIGVPYEDEDGKTNSGVVNVIYGQSAGLSWVGNQLWSQHTAGVGGVRESHDMFGFSVAAGNLGRTGYADLAVGAPWEDYYKNNDGAVNVIYGSLYGLTGSGANLVWSQSGRYIEDVAEDSDYFGRVLAIGDVGRSGYGDLVVGVPYEDKAGKDDGVVNILYGSSSGVSRYGDQLLWQGVRDSRAGDGFGSSVDVP